MIEETDTLGGPRAMAELLVTQINDLETQITGPNDAKEAKRLRNVLKLKRGLLKWCKTRAGY